MTMGLLFIQLLVFSLVAFLWTNSVVNADSDDDDDDDDDDDSQINFVVIMADDVGFGDLASYGHVVQEWEAIDDLAAGGMKFLSWYSAESICTPSRTALLTGRLAARVGMVGYTRVLTYNSTLGLPKSEITIAEFLQDNGYMTGFVGKWHLGINEFNHHDSNHMPHHHGFEFVGHNLPLTNLAWCKYRQGSTLPVIDNYCFLYKNATIVQQPIDLTTMAPKFVADAKYFINEAKNVDRPFFLYYALSNTHADLTTMPEFVGTSKRGFYGDNMREMQWQVEEIINTLKQNDVDKKTVIFFMSDNGPQEDLCKEGGSTGGLRGDKGRSFEGGVRVPGIVYWPNVIKAGSVSHAVANTMDVLPTIADIIDVQLPAGRTYDGISLLPVLRGESQESGREITYFYCAERLMAIRYGNYKVHYVTLSEIDSNWIRSECPDGGYPVTPMAKLDRFKCWGPEATIQDPPLVYKLDIDPTEEWPLNPEDPDEKVMLQELAAVIEAHNGGMPDFGDVLPLDDENRNWRVTPCCNEAAYPQCSCNYDYPDPHFFVPFW